MDTDKAKEPVDINTRYSSAWAEINIRLTLRTQNISIFITLMLAIATLSQLKVDGLDTKWIVLAVPIISLMSAMTHYMHSRIIQNLTSYLEDLEEFNNPISNEIPNYLSDKDYAKSDEYVVNYQQIVFFGLMLLFNLTAFVYEYYTKPEIFYLNSLIIVFSACITLLSLSFVGIIFKKHRVKPKRPTSLQSEIATVENQKLSGNEAKLFEAVVGNSEQEAEIIKTSVSPNKSEEKLPMTTKIKGDKSDLSIQNEDDIFNPS